MRIKREEEKNYYKYKKQQIPMGSPMESAVLQKVCIKLCFLNG
jgi:hypothetical protein